MSRRRAVALPALALAVAGAAGATWLALRDPGAGKATASRGAGGSAAVERRDLVESETVDGTLGYTGRRAVVNRLNGTITWLPREGAVVRRGRRLFEVSGRPVLLFYGSVPAYRTLTAGVADGADVAQLERNLAALGYSPGVVDDHFSASTAAAVARWQDGLGLAQTGRVELGRVAFLPGPRRVSSVTATLGGGAGQDGGGGGMANAAYTGETTSGFSDIPEQDGRSNDDEPEDEPQRDRPRSGEGGQSDPPRTEGGSSDDDGGGAEGEGNGAEGEGDGAAGGGGSSGGGGAAGADPAPATEVMETTSNRRVVTVKLDADKQQLAVRGKRAEVTLPDGVVVRGRIARVGSVAKVPSSSGQDPEAGGEDATAQITVTIRLTGRRPPGRLDEAPVSVDLARETSRGVLAVPATALQATAGGGYAVEVVERDGTQRLLRVEPGLFADGYVEVEGPGLREGMRVSVPR
jgi:peptidoglycan hydrolase-like protein with peptidoglycan-binding domain